MHHRYTIPFNTGFNLCPTGPSTSHSTLTILGTPFKNPAKPHGFSSNTVTEPEWLTL